MNSTQISNCLRDIYGSKSNMMNQWIDMSKVSCIYLDQDANLYPDKKHVQFYFDSSDSILKVRTGKIVNGIFTPDDESVPNHIISFNAICGFIRTSIVSEVGQFEYSR